MKFRENLKIFTKTFVEILKEKVSFQNFEDDKEFLANFEEMKTLTEILGKVEKNFHGTEVFRNAPI